MKNILKKYLRIDLNKNAKLGFYLKGIWILIVPQFIYKRNLKSIYNSLSIDEKNYIDKRVNYYNKIDNKFTLPNNQITIQKFIFSEKKKTYFFDLLEHLKHFNYNNKISYLFGDIIEVPDIPTIVKSRPIKGNNSNSILMKLNKVRHFIFVNDKIDFKDKKDMLIWRGGVGRPARIEFMEKYFDHPLCDIGQTNKRKSSHDHWKKPKVSVAKQLKYKFLISIEGNDVASNLKWAMSSNSLVLMKKPIYETWFMEGTLIADFHYVLLKDDYSDLIEKMEYYSKNIDKAKEIIKNANLYVEQFKHKDFENIISYMVLDKFFANSSTKL